MMKQMHRLVIPKISIKWKAVAELLEIETDNIEDKWKGDSADCCEEVLRVWINSDHGLQPKTWSTLILAIKEIKQLALVSEEIKKELKSESLYTLLYQILMLHTHR